MVATSYLLAFGSWGVWAWWEGSKEGLGVVQEVDKITSASLVHEDLVGGGWIVEVTGAGAGMKKAFREDVCDGVAGREVPGCVSIRVGARAGGGVAFILNTSIFLHIQRKSHAKKDERKAKLKGEGTVVGL